MIEQNYSVLMSVYRKEKAEYLQKSIDSMLSQTVPPQDFVIVCDGLLGDELNQVLRKKKQEYPECFQIVQLPENRGLGEALKEGLVYCKNELVARMDSDDISVPERCEWQLKAFAQNNVSIISGAVQEFMDDTAQAGTVRYVPESSEKIAVYAKKRNPFNHPAVMFKKSDVIKAGSYMDLHGFEDYYLWLRMLSGGMKGYNLSEVLVYMRVGNGMYARRGGVSYLKDMAEFRKIMLNSGYINLLEFLASVIVRGIVILMPANLRKTVYSVFLRK